MLEDNLGHPVREERMVPRVTEEYLAYEVIRSVDCFFVMESIFRKWIALREYLGLVAKRESLER